MKILNLNGSKSDYYDMALSYGVDETRILKRNPLSIQLENINNIDLNKIKSVTSKLLRGDLNSLVFRHILFFCGDIYYIIDQKKADGSTDKISIFSDIVEADNSIKDISENLMRLTRLWRLLPGDHLSNEIISSSLLQISKELSAPYFLLSANDNHMVGREIIVNTWVNLKSLGFSKTLPPHEAYQRVEQFYFDEMMFNKVDLIEIEDKYKITAKGFDLKESFRTRK